GSQARLVANGATCAVGDDPNGNGAVEPNLPGDEDPTRVTIAAVAGAGQRVTITNTVSVVGGGPAVPGAQLDYVLNIVNNGAVPASNVVITDDLNGSQPGQLTYVPQSATANGLTAGVSFSGSTITFNYATVNGPLAPGGTVVL